MVTHGKKGEFSLQHEDWISYSELLQEYFIANEIEATAKKKAILLSMVGVEMYQFM